MITPPYLAGLLDADGHFTWRAGKWQTALVGATNTSDALMGALTEALGGSVSRQRRLCPGGCSLAHIHRHADILRWQVTGYRAVLVCKTVLPHLVIKGDRAADVIGRYYERLDLMERPARRAFHMSAERAAYGWN